ncbi:uncharacterized protein FOMMEDRAFT_157930 [Fomitiporia mediterranea MF3/22]|uniref:uncharacterized protein n=1 Tax=Fomitiporia mediterranea (strain MF3/22) TaxID=694068 RepID=UPI0004407605|nr:uncharacterized protein FOMMEDRAFT_157930 [Fomitiporia mediterranea MF3/22]EJD00824.1 hypothetical protein FOMMEDRAFT_157930 [Fomitiporia mediterranea MF3/22]
MKLKFTHAIRAPFASKNLERGYPVSPVVVSTHFYYDRAHGDLRRGYTSSVDLDATSTRSRYLAIRSDRLVVSEETVVQEAFRLAHTSCSGSVERDTSAGNSQRMSMGEFGTGHSVRGSRREMTKAKRYLDISWILQENFSRSLELLAVFVLCTLRLNTTGRWYIFDMGVNEKQMLAAYTRTHHLAMVKDPSSSSKK